MATKEELEYALQQARQELGEAQKWIDSVTAPPHIYAPIVSVGKDTMDICQGGNVITMPLPPKFKKTARIGAMVTISMETKVPVSISEKVAAGPIVTVQRRLDDESVEISLGATANQSNRVVFCSPEMELKDGDLVQLDIANIVVLRNLGPDPAKKKANVVQDFQPVGWDEIGGLDDVKQFFFEVLERPLLAPEVYKAYNVPLPKGCLLAGPPGCGKTLIAKAAMTDMLMRYKHSGAGAFLMVKGPEILSPWVGVAEQNIRNLFTRARTFKQENGFPCFIFIDEAEAILNVRGSGRSSDIDRTIIPAFLAEMDGVEESGALVILATNRPEMLDPAIIREGRIDKKVLVPRPNASTFCRILEINLQKYPLANKADANSLAVRATQYVFDDRHTLYNVKMEDGSSVNFAIRHVLSGALGAAMVQQSASLALNRDISTGKVSGLNITDLIMTFDELVKQHRHLNYRAELDDFLGTDKDNVLTVERVCV